MLAPICLFTYNRPDLTKQTVAALQRNYISRDSKLFIFSDGSKNKTDSPKVNSVRTYLNKITGFQSVTIFESSINKGLANSIIDGVSQIIEQHGKVIVLEDDLVTSPNFLDFMNQALDFYKNNPRIFSVSGYSLDLPSLDTLHKDYYLGYRASSWGWGTWSNMWDQIDWDVKSYSSFKYNLLQQLKFMRGGSDLPRMLKNQMKGRIDSWAIRWCYSQFRTRNLTVFPAQSKIINIGFGENSTNTKKGDRFISSLDNGKKREFSFSNNVSIDKKLNNEYRTYYSIRTRLKRHLNIK